ncbi:MAG: cation:proton antiporter, partial [Bacteroidota bacterium]|nr:cation:proton antiporter [Bacteroidota bacterium]
MPILSELLLIMLFSAVALFLCHKIGIPPLIGYLLTGILVGPSALGLITQVEMVDSLANIGVILLMFSVGLQFSLGELARMGRAVLIGMGLQMGLTILAITALGALLGFETRESVFYGFLIAASSTAIILKSLQESGQAESPHGRLAVSISISQDIGMILLVLLIPLFVGSDDFDLVGNVGGLLLKSALTLVAVIVTARYVAPAVLYQIARTRDRELFLFVIVILCFAIAWLVSAIGLSLALGAFLAGLIVSESEYSNQAIGNIIPFKDLFASIFFVSIGMMLDTAAFLRAWPAIFGLSLAIIAGKTVLALLAVLLLRYPLRTALLSAIALIPIGEFSFILAVAGLNAGVITQEGYQIFLASSIFSMAATPVLIGWGPGIADLLARFTPAARATAT